MNLLFWYRSLMRSAGAALVKLIVTATSGLVSFTTNVIRPVKVTCEFSPVREGTGDPSPDNVRPISGWGGCEILHTGKNLVPDFNVTYEFWSSGWLNNSGGIMPSNNPYITSAFVEIKPKNSYIFSRNSNGWQCHAFFDKDKILISGTYKETNSGTAPQNAKYIRISMAPNKSGATYLPTAVQLELGTTVTGKENYVEPVSLPITFTDPSTGDPLTVYGGAVTLNEDGSADLVSDVRLRTLVGTESWANEAETETYNMKFKLNLSDMMYGSNITNAMTNYIKRRESQNEGYKNGPLCCQFGWNDHRIFVLNATKDIADVSDLATWKAYLADHPLEIVYPLTTPTTYHFDSIVQLQSFLGTNNIWHNMNGDISVEYWNKQ